MNYSIVYEDDTELAEFEALNKGYRKDVIVVIGEKKYRLYITDIVGGFEERLNEVEKSFLEVIRREVLYVS